MIVYDPTRPGTQHRIRTGGARVQWSPDGTWIAALSHADARLQLPDSLFGIDVRTGNREVLWVGPNAWPFDWASDGSIYLLASRKDLVRIAPPMEWRNQWKPGSHYASLILGSRWGSVPYGNSRMRVAALGLQRLSPRESARLDTLPALDSLFAFGNLLLHDQVPQQRRFLVWGQFSSTHMFVDVVVDDWGHLISPKTIKDPKRFPAPHALSMDSRFGFGADVLRVEDDGSDTGKIVDAQVTALDLEGRWKVPIEGARPGIEPWESHEGNFLAYEDPATGDIVVGRLEVEFSH
jgi:hypothetical protein